MAKSNQEVNYDVCIIGSGPAGIIMALEYSELNPLKQVILVEYGKRKIKENTPNQLDDSIQNRNPINHHNPYESTNKGLGGTSATWGGRCVMYDPVDFVSRPILNGGCTWDLRILKEVKDFLPRATDYFECGRPVFSTEDVPQFRDERIAENFKNGIVTDKVLERWSMPTRFGERYRATIKERANLTLMEEVEAREFSMPDPQGKVSSIIVRNTTNYALTVIKSKLFVLAAGAQETTRILLRNLKLFKNLECPPSALGNYYQGHVSGKIASVKFKGDPKKTDFSFLRDIDGTYIRRRLQFSSEFLIENNLLNTAIWLDNTLYMNPKHRSGAMSFMYLAMIIPFLGKRLAPPAIAHSITKGQKKDISKHFRNLIKGFPNSFLVPASIFYRRYLLKRKLPGIFLYSKKNEYALHFHSEQVLDISNSMKLDADGESLIINYSLKDPDVESVIKLRETLDSYPKENDCGELLYWYSKEELPDAIRKMSIDGIHQVGTTRIADSPEKGVVDRNLRVWGTNNIYVCSSSVFPTSGQANPTFLLGAFSVRLARHLTNN